MILVRMWDRRERKEREGEREREKDLVLCLHAFEATRYM